MNPMFQQPEPPFPFYTPAFRRASISHLPLTSYPAYASLRTGKHFTTPPIPAVIIHEYRKLLLKFLQIMLIKIQKITPKTLFKIVFAGYLLGGMHFTMHHPGGYGLYLPFNTVGWMFISALIGIGFWQIAISEKIIFSRFHIFCWIGFGLMCLPLLYQNNENSGLVLHRFLGLGAGLLLYLAFQQFHFNSKDRHWFLYIILAGILIQTFYGLAQHFLPLESWFGIIVAHPFGVLMQKNIMATFLVTGTAISLFLLIKDDVIMQSNLKKRMVFLTPILTSILYIPLSSRTGYLTFTIAIGLLLILGNKKKKQVRTWIGLALIGFLIGSSLPSLGTKMPYSIESTLSRPTTARKLFYKLTFELWRLDPLTGIGYGNFFSSFRHHYAERRSRDSSIIASSGNIDHPHNETLFWMVEGGIVPLIGLLIIAGGFLIMLWQTKSREAWGTAGLIIPILIHTQVELPFYLSLIHWFLFIFLLYCIDEDFGEWQVKKMSWKIFPRVVAVIIPGIIIPYMVTALQTGFVITKFERTGLNNIGLLLSAWNPNSLHKKFDTQSRRIHLNFAKETKDNEGLQDFIDWAEQYVQHSPYLFIYYDMATAYEAMGEREKAWGVIREAQYLFPDTEIMNKYSSSL